MIRGYLGLQVQSNFLGPQGNQGPLGVGLQGPQGSKGCQGSQGRQGDQGNQGDAGPVAVGFRYLADTTDQTDTDPGNGKFKWNNLSQPATTQLYVDYLDADGNDWSAFYASLGYGDRIRLQSDSIPNVFQEFVITGVTDRTGWYRFDVIIDFASAVSFSNGESTALIFYPTGNQGNQGNTGNQGPVGRQGTQGAQGRQGLTGPQGYQGTQGCKGGQGAQGIVGDQGAQGDAGGQGWQGIQGIGGTDGLQGAQGWQGGVGDQGNQGPGVTPAPVAVVQARRTTQYVVTNTFADLTLDTTDVKTDATSLDHDNAINSERITCLSAGTYLFQWATDIEATVGGTFYSQLFKNGIAVVPGGESNIDLTDGTSQVLFGSVFLVCSAGDFFTLQVKKDSGATGTVDVGAMLGAELLEGPSGAQGRVGSQGDQGIQGVQGTNPGPTGPQGWQGWQGGIGPQGNQGWQGGIGPQGSQGWQGVQGRQGWQGFQGDQGWQGWQGSNAQLLVFGRRSTVPDEGTLQLAGPDSSFTGVALIRAGTITGASIVLDAADADTYRVSIRVNGTEQAVLDFAGVTSAYTGALAYGVNAGDIITVWVTRQSGTGESAFADMQAVVEVSY